MPLKPWENYERHVTKILRTIGFQNIRHNCLIQGFQADILAELKISGFSINTMIECKFYNKKIGNEIASKFLERIKFLRQNDKITLGILVTNIGFSKEAREVVKDLDYIRLFTDEELLHFSIGFLSLMEKLVDEYENFEKIISKEGVLLKNPIIDILTSHNFKYYINLEAKEENILHSPVETFLEDWCKTDNNEHILILGDLGTGKTSLLTTLCYKISKMYLNSSAENIIPLYFPLKEYSPDIMIFEDFIEKILTQKYNLKISYEKIIELMKEQTFVFLFDGFDEINCVPTVQNLKKNLMNIIKFANFPSKIILTCRTHFFKTHEKIIMMFSSQGFFPKPKFRILTLQSFSKKQISKLLESRLKNPNLAWEKIKNKYDLKDLSSRPLLLDMIIQTYDKLFEEEEKISSARLYEKYTNIWINREIEKSPITLKQKENFMQLLAYQMYTRLNAIESYTIHHSEISDLLHKLKLNPKDLAILDNDIRTCSFLHRYENGDYRFVHKSFMEFFVAKKIISEIKENNPEMYGVPLISHQIAIFINDILRMNKKSTELVNIMKSNKSDYFERVRAAITMGEIGDESFVPVLIESLINDKNDNVKIASAISLGLIGDKRALDCLKQSLFSKKVQYYIRLTCAYRIGLINTNHSIEILVHALKTEKNRSVIFWALEALGALGRINNLDTDLCLDFLKQFEKHEDPLIAEKSKVEIQKISYLEL